jgi:hypothetical protein
MSMPTSLIPAFASAGLLAAAITLRFSVIDPRFAARQEVPLAADVLKSPGVDVLRLATAEHALLAADLTWLAIVQELGRAETVSEATWDRVERWSDIATDLDPRYFTVYHSVAVNLTVYTERVAASDRVLHKGWRVLPNRWELPLLLGYNAYFIHGDAEVASDYIARASQLPQAPFFLAPLAGRMRFHSGDEFGAIELLEYMLPHLEGRPREEAQTRLMLLKSEQRMRRFDAACKTYREQRGALPESGQAVVDAGLIEEPPSDELGAPITFDEDCVARTEHLRVREFEAKKRVGSRNLADEEQVIITPVDPKTGAMTQEP